MKEIRLIDNTEFRAVQEEDKKYIEGYAFKYNTLSRDLGGFYETIERGSLDGADLSDVVALFNHKQEYILARKNVNVDTLELIADEVGLKYRFEVDESISYVADLYKNIQKKNIQHSSFAFKIAEGGDKFEKRDGKYYRSITKFKGIYDVSPVTNPAYLDTDSSIRSIVEGLQEGEKQEEINNLNEYRMKLLKVK
ncbi:HK97 family phage prohead protease [Arthrospiribacter ruber]|uniref:HK97 family phage prohead protease n=1 Tax=Arthrospiribacter ruber TaxID=2487934 RepID=A0A951IZ75_9BACT|nr:HK97 family phage prohead protease [Arthrospiribacter ruber]MBW3469087.1 HK97 family phage prohead protease [Arthrospiribacter ruber]